MKAMSAIRGLAVGVWFSSTHGSSNLRYHHETIRKDTTEKVLSRGRFARRSNLGPPFSCLQPVSHEGGSLRGGMFSPRHYRRQCSLLISLIPTQSAKL